MSYGGSVTVTRESFGFRGRPAGICFRLGDASISAQVIA